MSAKLTSVSLSGFKTFRESPDFELRPINVLIGANSAGKSNFLSFFRMLAKMLDPSIGLQRHVIINGGANTFLHDGSKATQKIRVCLRFETENGAGEYAFQLLWRVVDSLFFTEEFYRFTPFGQEEPPWQSFGATHEETLLGSQMGSISFEGTTALWKLLTRCVTYHFEDTSDRSPLRSRIHRDDGRYLYEDGGNLPAFLLRLRESSDETERFAFDRIEKVMRLLVPSFAQFVLEPEGSSLILRWREEGSDRDFHAGQAPDGMLRLAALVTLLSQPNTTLPGILIIDEPELGLHPDAIAFVAGLMRSASKVTQLIVATQSPELVDEFEPEDIVVVQRKRRESLLERKSKEELKVWMDEYSLGDLWRKNVLGGGPFA
jgi:predicted ATPase